MTNIINNENNQYINKLYVFIESNQDIISSFEIIDGQKGIWKCYLDWPNYRIQFIDKLTIVNSKKYKNIIEPAKDLIKKYYPFTSFNIEIRDKIIYEYPYKKIIRTEKCPIFLHDWVVIGNPIPNKYFAITKFKIVKNSPYKLSILAHKQVNN